MSQVRLLVVIGLLLLSGVSCNDIEASDQSRTFSRCLSVTGDERRFYFSNEGNETTHVCSVAVRSRITKDSLSCRKVTGLGSRPDSIESDGSGGYVAFWEDDMSLYLKSVVGGVRVCSVDGEDRVSPY